MIDFGQRSIFKQGGSFLISLPIQWVKSTNPVNVKIEIDDKQRIIITSVPAFVSSSKIESNSDYLKEGLCID